ncbi:DNA-processing protein DprA [bacterium]|nr:DNA-processing protein DprA [bacterium]
MTPDFTDNCQAMLLLCGHFGKLNGPIPQLSTSEYNKLAGWLRDANMQPADLLDESVRTRFLNDTTTVEFANRIHTLMSRGFALTTALEQWSQRGIWAISRANPDYPKRLKDNLRLLATPILFGVGDLSLATREGIAVAGSRNASEDAFHYARALGEEAARNDLTIITGGARGVDQAAMWGAFEEHGRAVGVLHSGLEAAAVKRDHRESIAEGRLLLISPFHPGAGFSAGNAMSRNKVIYALSTAAVIVQSDIKGGTWGGANEVLKHRWVPLFVRESEDPGNQRLIKLGGKALPGQNIQHDLNLLFAEPQGSDKTDDSQPSSPDPSTVRLTTANQSLPLTNRPGIDKPESKVSQEAACPDPGPKTASPEASRDTVPAQEKPSASNDPWTDHFLPALLDCLEQSKTASEVAELLQISKKTVDQWLKRAVSEGTVVKTRNPIRFLRKPRDLDLLS